MTDFIKTYIHINMPLKRENKHLSLYEIVNDFEPKDQNIPNAGYRIPEHQRFYKWNKDQEEKFIDSILNGYPVPSFIAFQTVDVDGNIIYYVEDGHQRLTALWRFVNGKSTYKGKIFSENVRTDKSQKVLSDNQRRDFENYQVPWTIFKGRISPEDKAEIFGRLNNGTPLKDSDKFWAMKRSSLVKFTIDLCNSPSLNSIGKFITPNNHTDLPHIVGFVAGCAFGDAYTTTSYEKLYNKLNESPDENKVYKCIEFISSIYNDVNSGKYKLNKTDMKKLGKFNGLLISEFNTCRNQNQINQCCEFWTKFLSLIAFNHNDTKFWNMIVCKDKRGANLTTQLILNRIEAIKAFMNKSKQERLDLCKSLEIEYAEF